MLVTSRIEEDDDAYNDAIASRWDMAASSGFANDDIPPARAFVRALDVVPRAGPPAPTPAPAPPPRRFLLPPFLVGDNDDEPAWFLPR